MKYLKLLPALLIIISFVMVSSAHVYAFDAFKDTCDGSVEANQSSVCQDNGKTSSSASTIPDTINKVANIMAVIAGIMAVIYIMISGLTMITSTGDSAKISKARDSIIYASVGIVIIALARSIIFVILKYI